MKYEIKDSGVRESFPSGSVRDSQDMKGRYDLLPFSSLERIAIHTELGAKKYGDRNWEKGQPIKRYINSAIRHITKFAMGYRDEDHLAACAWNVMAAMWTTDQVIEGTLPPQLGEGYVDGQHRRAQCTTQEQDVTAQDNKKGEEVRSNIHAKTRDDLCRDWACDGCDTPGCLFVCREGVQEFDEGGQCSS